MIKLVLSAIGAILIVLATVIVNGSEQLAHQQSGFDLSLTETGAFDPVNVVGEFYGQMVSSVTDANDLLPTKVLGGSTGNKRIEIDLTKQRLYAYEDSTLIYNFLISSGKWGRTPTGTFAIWSKFRYKRMSGGNKALHTYYNLPNVPYTMFFSNAEVPASRGYGIHGTYWHKNFGHPMSHGCINMKTEEAALLYQWAGPNTQGANYVKATADNPGTPVIIYGTAPKE